MVASSLDLGSHAAERPAGVALVDATTGATLTWSELGGRVAAVARRLATHPATSDHRPEVPIAFVADATPATFVLLHALIAAGRSLLPVHPRLGPTEGAALAASLGATPVVDVAELVDLAEPAAAHDTARELTGRRSVPPDDERPLAVLATSGTSAAPKGVVLPRRAFAASAAASARNLPLGPGDRWLACMPLAHAGGLSIVTRTLIAGAGVVLLPRFDAGALLEAIAVHHATHLSVVPTMLAALLEHPDAAALARVDQVLVGGAACPVDLLREARGRGVAALASYGLTEACSQVTTQPRGDVGRDPEGDSGVPLDGVAIAVRGPDGEHLGPEREGEILVRGPTLMTGYRGAAPRAPSDWHPTGDVGQIRADGRLVVIARRTDLIVTGGENVAPAAVEAALLAHPAVREVVAFGVDEPRWGQVVAAAIVVAPGTDLDRVVTEVGTGLPAHARPRRVVAVDGVPRTTKGEPDRAAARDRWSAVARPVTPR